MKTIYLNNEYQCSTIDKWKTSLIAETNFFDGKCNTFIEGYRFVPLGLQWTRSDGSVFEGEMISPFKDIKRLEEIQDLHDEISTQQTSQDSQIAYIGMMTGVI